MSRLRVQKLGCYVRLSKGGSTQELVFQIVLISCVVCRQSFLLKRNWKVFVSHRLGQTFRTTIIWFGHSVSPWRLSGLLCSSRAKSTAASFQPKVSVGANAWKTPTTSMTPGASHGKSEERTAEGTDIVPEGTQIPEKSIASSQVWAPTPGDRSMDRVGGQHPAPGDGNVKRTQDLAPTSRKRDRDSGADAQNATKKLKNQTTRAGSPVRKEDTPVFRLSEADRVGDRYQNVESTQGMLSLLRSTIEIVSEDVQLLESRVLRFKRESAFHKHVVHRSVFEESGKIRGDLQTLQSNMVKVIDERTRETELILTERFESMLASYHSMCGMKGLGAIGHGNGHVWRAIPSGSRDSGAPRGNTVPQEFFNVRDSDHQRPDASVVTDIPERVTQCLPKNNFKEHSESPPAIANESRLGDCYDESQEAQD